MTKILACIDGTPGTSDVCDYAVWAARRLLAPLTFLHVIDRQLGVAPMHDFSGSLGLGAQESLLRELSALDEQRSRLAQEHGRQILEGACARAAEAGLTDVEGRQQHGTLVDTLLEWQDEIRLIVLGQHPHDSTSGRRHLDHHVERVIRAVHRPVLVAAGAFRPIERFAIAFDASGTGRRMVETVARSPFLRGLPCEVVTSTGDPASISGDLRWAEQTLAEAGYDVRTAAVTGEPEDVLNQHVRDRDMHLLVMGAYGHSRIRHLVVGSTTTSLLRTSQVPVLVLR